MGVPVRSISIVMEL